MFLSPHKFTIAGRTTAALINTTVYKQERSLNYWGKMQFSEGKEKQEQIEESTVEILLLIQPFRIKKKILLWCQVKNK